MDSENRENEDPPVDYEDETTLDVTKSDSENDQLPVQDADDTTKLFPKSKKDSIFVRHKKKCRFGAGFGLLYFDWSWAGYIFHLLSWTDKASCI